MRAQLLPNEGGPPIDIVKDLTVVGRKDECDVKLDHKSVSKMHCVIVKTDGLLLLRDLGSTNGTRVNGQRVRRAALLPDDQLTIAHFKFKVSLGPDEPAPVAVSAANAHIDQHTQALEAAEVAELLRKAKAQKHEERDDDSSDDVPNPQMQRNPLPDVYPDK